MAFLSRLGLLSGLRIASQSGLRLAASGTFDVTGSALGFCTLPAPAEISHLATVNRGATKGPGGRSSVSGLTATVFGANGFIGSYVVNQLAQRGTQVVVPYRGTDNEVQHIKQMGDLGQVILLPEFTIRDSDERIRQLISRSNVIVNLIGMRMESMNYTYEEVHVEWPARLARIAASSPQLERFIQFSEAGATEQHGSRRMRTRALGDRKVLEAVPLATILRAAPVVGTEDFFYNQLIYQVAYSVFAPLPDGGHALVQPTYVQDVADAVMQTLRLRDSVGKTYYLGGPEVMSWRQVYDLLIKTLRLNRNDAWDLPAWLLKLVWGSKDRFRRLLPNLPASSFMQSADYVEEMIANKIVPKGALGYIDLEVTPMKVTEGLPMEPVRHARVGGYRWGDFSAVVKDVPDNIKRYYNIK